MYSNTVVAVFLLFLTATGAEVKKTQDHEDETTVAAAKSADLASDAVTEDHWPPVGISLSSPPSAWPGHLQPLGAAAPNAGLDHRKKGFIHPDTFFNDYVSTDTPLVFDTAALIYPAATKWKVDSYFLDIPHSSTTWINATSADNQLKEMKLRQFFLSYNKTAITYQGRTPSFMKVDVMYPTLLQCDSIKELMLTESLELSPGGEASGLQSSDHDQLTCQLVGNANVVLISPKFRSKLPAETSEVNTKKVNFDKFPGLREVDYHRTELSAGACIYLPAKWQYITSRPSRSIAHTLRWQRLRSFRLLKRADCGKWSQVPTLVAMTFSGMNETADDFTLDAAFHFLAFSLEGGNHSYDKEGFLKRMSKDITLLSKTASWNEEYAEIYQELFDVLDINGDKNFSQADLDVITEKELSRVRGVLADRMADLSDIIQDQNAEHKAGQTMVGDLENKIKESTDGMNKNMQNQIDAMKRVAKELNGGKELQQEDLDQLVQKLDEKLAEAKKKIAEEDAAEAKKKQQGKANKKDKKETGKEKKKEEGGEEYTEPKAAYRQDSDEAEEILAEEDDKSASSMPKQGTKAEQKSSKIDSSKTDKKQNNEKKRNPVKSKNPAADKKGRKSDKVEL